MIIASLKKSSLYLYACFFLSFFFNDGSVSDVTACIKAEMEQLTIAINEATSL